MTYIILHSQTGATPLFIACQKNHGEIVDRLLSAKADVNLQKKVGKCNIYHHTVLLWLECWNTACRVVASTRGVQDKINVNQYVLTRINSQTS